MKCRGLKTAVMSVITVCLILGLSACRDSAATETTETEDFAEMTEYVPLTSVITETVEAEISMQIVPPAREVPEQVSEDVSETETDDSDSYYEESESPSEAAETAETVEYTVNDVSKTVYIATPVNVRSGPWTDFDKVGSLASGTEVTVTGVCNETGWYRISYEGGPAYFDCNYAADTLTQAQPENETKAESKTETKAETNAETGGDSQTAAVTASPSPSPSPSPTETYVSGGFPLWNYGWHTGEYLGRLRIPSVGADVAIYNSNSQATSDAVDSAAFGYYWELYHDMYNYSTIYCGDHNYQGFIVIKNCTIGCALYIDGVDGNTYKYVCDRIDYNGYNTGWGLNDCNGNSVNETGGLWCYTCHEDSMSYIYMVHFTAV